MTYSDYADNVGHAADMAAGQAALISLPTCALLPAPAGLL
jgi:hypothetical protein